MSLPRFVVKSPNARQVTARNTPTYSGLNSANQPTAPRQNVVTGGNVRAPLRQK